MEDKNNKNFIRLKKGEFINEAYIVSDLDVLNFVTKSSTKAQRKRLKMGDIYINGAVCKKCGDYIRSKHVHDYVVCSCGAVAVDGGSWYAKRSGDPKNYINVIECFIK